MKDPFPIPPIPALSRFVAPYAERLGLVSLPLHIHEVAFSFGLYMTIHYAVGPRFSRAVFPRSYAKLTGSRRLNWDVHVVSFVQSVLVCGMALWVMAVDEERGAMDWDQRVWGYTGASGLIQAFATGYFLYDLVITLTNVQAFGLAMLAHAVCALGVFSLGFRPFVNYYGPVFILWELSTPFLNIHWFLDKLDMTGGTLQLVNGLGLISVFFGARLCYGTYQSTRVFYDIYRAYSAGHPALKNTFPTYYSAAPRSAADEVWMFATDSSTVPTWLALVYLLSNSTLNSLNVMWFFKMLAAVQKRFTPEAKEQREKAAAGAETNGKAPKAPARRPSIVEELAQRHPLIDGEEALPAAT